MQVTDETYRKNLLRALADDQARKIIARTISGGKSVADIVRECNIAHTSSYRLVNELKNQGLLIIEKIAVGRDGKKYLLYRSCVRDVIVNFEGGIMSVEVSPNVDIIEKTQRLFSRVSETEHP